MTTALSWQKRVGNQRDWVWRGWQIRYTFIRPVDHHQTATPLILLHGFGASIGQWRHNLEGIGETPHGLCSGYAGFWRFRKGSR